MPPPWAASVVIVIVEKSAPPAGGVYVNTPVVLSYAIAPSPAGASAAPTLISVSAIPVLGVDEIHCAPSYASTSFSAGLDILTSVKSFIA